MSQEVAPRQALQRPGLKRLKLMVAFQGENDEVIDYVQVEMDYFHNGFAFVVLWPGMPHAQHPNLAQAAMDMVRLLLIEKPDFMQQHRKEKPRGQEEGSYSSSVLPR